MNVNILATEGAHELLRKYKEGPVLAFPYPTLLSSIEDLLKEVQWLEGLILVGESRRPAFVSFAQLGALFRRLRLYPGGVEVARLLRDSLLERNGSCTAKPVLVLRSNGRFWLGLMDIDSRNHKKDKEIEHLNRCFNLNILE